jgi:hypothetical protein
VRRSVSASWRRALLGSPAAGETRDAHSEVGLTLDTLRRLRLLSGTHVLVTGSGNGVSRLARVVALEPGGAWQDGARPHASRRPALLV